MGTPAQRLESERTLYPALQVDEILVWRMWLQLYQLGYDRFDYNVLIGPEQDPGPLFTPEIRQMAIKLRQLRIDAVGYQGDSATIFEVERRAAPRSVGQLLAYGAMWAHEGRTPANPTLVLVAAQVTPNLLPLVAGTGIRLDVVTGVNFSVLAPGRLIPNP